MGVDVVFLVVSPDVELVSNGFKTEWVELKLAAFVSSDNGLAINPTATDIRPSLPVTPVLNTQNAPADH